MAIHTLGGIASAGESEAARVSACGMILDRGWGKPDQPHSGAIDANIEIVIRQIIRGETPAKTIEASYTKKDNE
jgi:hypothetical protein